MTAVITNKEHREMQRQAAIAQHQQLHMELGQFVAEEMHKPFWGQHEMEALVDWVEGRSQTAIAKFEEANIHCIANTMYLILRAATKSGLVYTHPFGSRSNPVGGIYTA